jgi:hypothetical protein
MTDFVEPSPVAITDGVNTVAIDGSGAMSVSVAGGGGGVVVSGTVGVNNFPTSQAISGTVAVSNFPTSQAISGTVAVSNFPSSQAISGTVAVSGTTPVKQVFATAVTSGQQAFTASQAPLPITAATNGLFLTSIAANTATIYVGASYLSGTKGLAIIPGQTVWLPIGNASLLWAGSVTGTQLLSYLVL